MGDGFDYDVFLSHSSADKPIVRELARRLKADGVRVWFDEWVIQPGDSIPLAIEQGLESSRALVLAMSRDAFSSDWVTLERHTAVFRDPTNRHKRFVPLRLDDADIRDSLRQFAYIDWRKRDDNEYRRLLELCRPPATDSDVCGPRPSPLRLPIVSEFAAESQHIVFAQSVQEAMQRVLRSLERFGCRGGMISLCLQDGEEDWVVSQAATSGAWSEDIAHSTRRAVGENDILATVVRTRERVFVQDAATDVRCDQHIVRLGGIKSFYALPLFDLSHDVIGVLQIDLGDHVGTGRLPYEQRAVLDAVGVLAGASISRAIQAEELSVSRRLDQALVESLDESDPIKRLSSFFSRMVEILRLHGGHVRLYSSDSENLVKTVGVGAVFEHELGHHLFELRPSSRAFVRNRMLLVNETSFDRLQTPFEQDLYRVRCHCSMPLSNFGVMHVESTTPWFFTPWRLRSLRDVAQRIHMLIGDNPQRLLALANQRAVPLFFAYARVDEDLRNDIEKHMSRLIRKGIVSVWHDSAISAGTDWDKEIKRRIDASRIILLLVSSDFLASDYCRRIEMRKAIRRHNEGKSRVVPVIIRPVDWAGEPFGRLQALPANGMAVTEWQNRDEAFLDIVRGIEQVAREISGD